MTALSRLGPEPLGISALEFSHRVRAKHREIKPLLLDQHFLAGVGNIYADESLSPGRNSPPKEIRFPGRKNLIPAPPGLARGP